MILISVLVTPGVARQKRQYVLTFQQLPEREIGVKPLEDDTMMRHVIRGAMARRGCGSGSGRGSQ
jgi:hypothetical protein